MITAYFDDSGTDQRSRIAIASCYLGEVQQWDLLAREWEDAKSRFGFEYFGMSDCLVGRERTSFEGWSWPQKDALIRHLIGITSLRARMGFSAAIIKDDYDAVVSGWKRRIVGENHFGFAVKDCLRQIRNWRRQYNISEPIQYVFDLMGTGKDEIEFIFESFLQHDPEGIGVTEEGYSFKNKRNFPPLQAVDILAHQSYAHMRDCVIGKKKKCEDYMRILGKIPTRTRYYDKQILEELILKYPWDEVQKNHPELCT